LNNKKNKLSTYISVTANLNTW